VAVRVLRATASGHTPSEYDLPILHAAAEDKESGLPDADLACHIVIRESRKIREGTEAALRKSRAQAESCVRMPHKKR
jgi:hypothetical protein